MNREQKKQAVIELNDNFNNATSVIVTQYTGLSVAEVTTLRNNLRKEGAKFKVAKNRLVKIALKGSKYEQLSDMFSGQTAIAFSEDPVSAAKGVVEFANNNEKLVIVGGALNDKLMDQTSIKSLAKLPSIDELRAKLVGLLQAPATKVACVLQAPAGQIARVVNAYSNKG